VPFAHLAAHSKVLELELIKNSPNEESTRIGEMLLRCGAMTEQELAAALQVQQSEEPSSTRALGSILVAQQAVYPEVVEAAAAKQKQIKEAHAQESRSIRVDADKLDH
jgi:two-component system chemotaxis sensor kinase CheA